MLTIAIIAGVVILIVTTKHRRRRPAQHTRTQTVTTKTITIRPSRPKTDEQMRREARQAEADRMKRCQAADDLIHLDQVRRDMLAAYQTAKIDGDSEKAIRKRIAYDEQMRRIEKRIEKATFEANH